MKDWIKWGVIGGILAVLIPLLIGPGLDGTDNIFYFYGIGASIATKFFPENLWHIVLWVSQFMLGVLIAFSACYIYCRAKK